MHSQKALPNLKRKQKVLPLHERVVLEKVLGFTINNSCALATDPNTGQIAYPAGCVVVLYNPRKNKQTHLVNNSKKAITCLAFSRDGRYLATGECGHQPAVRLWDLDELSQIAEFQGHKFGINAVIFSPNQKNLISVGSQYDMMVNVWNWKTQCKVASNKVAAKVTGIAFSEDSSTFVTVGNRHVKFWNMDSSKSRIKETVPLKGHSGILGEQKNNFFCGVCFGSGVTASKTYVITRSGLLCEFNDNRLLDKWVELRTTSASCVVAQEHHVFVGCANGIVRVFNAETLYYITTLPRPHHLGVDVASGQDLSSVTTAPTDALYPDTVAISIDDEASKLTCIYNDHSLYIWDIHDIKRIGKCRSFLYHSSAIWGVEVYPVVEHDLGVLPQGSFITCSSDDTIRVWNVDSHMSTGTAYKRNIYSNELLKIIYTDPDLCNIVEKEFNPAGKTDKTDTQYQDTHGVRALSISQNGRHLASGDRVGNIRIHDLESMLELHLLEAHNSEVLCLEYSGPALGKNILASTSRDRFIHVFDCDNDYELLQTLDDHSAAITSVKFYETGDHQLSMLSCGMDKSLLFRTAQMDPEFQFVLTRHLVGKTTLYDMCLDPRQKYVATACQDRNIRIYNLKNGKHKKSYSGSTGSDGTLLRLAQDRSGAYVVASCSDKNVSIFDFVTGECMANMLGHSEVVTGIQFTVDMKHVISVSGDGCIFIWRLPYDLTKQMCKRSLDTKSSLANSNLSKRNGSCKNEGDFTPAIMAIDNMLATPDKNANLLADPGSQHKPEFRFSVGQLPSWAKRQVLQGTGNLQSANEQPTVVAPSGRWAHRSIVTSLLPESDRDRATNLPVNPLHGARTDNSKFLVETIIADDDCDDDDEDDDDDEGFKQFAPNQTFDENKAAFSQTVELDNEDEDEDDSLPSDNVVFFPTKEDEEEGSETTSKSYRVFEGDTASMVVESDGTEQSVESDDDDTGKMSTGDNSTPTTPDGDQFIMSQFSLDDAAEERFDHVLPDLPMTHPENTTRLSMSTRFLSLSQQQELRGVSKPQPSALQQRREIMAQAVLETKKRLQADVRDSRTKQTTSRGQEVKATSRVAATSLARSQSHHDIQRRGSTSTDDQDDCTQDPIRAANSVEDKKIEAASKKSRSYQSATKSSKAKSRTSVSNAKELSANRRSFGSSLSAGLKNKFKSTPDLVCTSDADKENGLSSSKTTEDLSNSGQVGGRKYLFGTRAQQDFRDPLVSSGSTNHQHSGSPAPSSSSGYVSATSSGTTKAGVITNHVTKAIDSTPSGVDKVSVSNNDTNLMPPPPSTAVISSKVPRSSSTHRTSMPELTLQQAKQILLGRPSTLASSGHGTASARRRSSAKEGTPSMLTSQRPRSALSILLDGTASDTGTTSSTSAPRTTSETAISKTSFQVVLDSVATVSAVVASTTAPAVSTYASRHDDLDEQPVNDVKMNTSVESLQGRLDPMTMSGLPKSLTSFSSPSTAAVASSTCLRSTPDDPKITRKMDIKHSGELMSEVTRDRETETPENRTSVQVSRSDDVQHENYDVAQQTSTTRNSQPKMVTVVPSSGQESSISPSRCLDSFGVPLMRHRDAHVYGRTRILPARQPNGAAGVVSSHVMSTTIRPPTIPAPLMPPRELTTHSSTVASTHRISDHVSSGHTSATWGPSTMNHEMLTAQWQRVQQNRDRQSSNLAESTVQDVASRSEIQISASSVQRQENESSSMPEHTALSEEAEIDEDNDGEVKRPDKTRSSPPASLITDVTKDVTNSCVILTPPSGVQTGSGREGKSVASDFLLALHRLLGAYSKAREETDGNGDSEELKLLRETLKKALSEITKVVGAPSPDFIPYLMQKDPGLAQSLTSSSQNAGSSQSQARCAHAEVLNMLDYYSSQLCQLVSEKLDNSKPGK